MDLRPYKRVKSDGKISNRNATLTGFEAFVVRIGSQHVAPFMAAAIDYGSEQAVIETQSCN